MDRCEIAEYGASDSNIEDLLHDWKNMNLSDDACLAFSPDGALLGYSSVTSWGQNLRLEFFIAPEWETVSLSSELLSRCEKRGAAIASRYSTDNPIRAKSFIAHVNNRDRDTLRQANFSFVKYHFQMRKNLAETLPEPDWPAGIHLRTVTPGKDDRQIHMLIETAFDSPSRPSSTFESWHYSMFREDLFDHSLWHIALDADEIIGASLGFAYPDGGWIRQLAVHPRWQRKGVGSALLCHSFIIFQKLGYNTVGLGVDGTNINAFNFYIRLGMQPVRQYEEYEKAITS